MDNRSLPDAIVPENSSAAGILWLCMAALSGFGGLAIAAWLGYANPSWCSAPFVGCTAHMILFAWGGCGAGLFLSVISLKNKGVFRIASWLVFIWNALGVLLGLALIVMFAIR